MLFKQQILLNIMLLLLISKLRIVSTTNEVTADDFMLMEIKELLETNLEEQKAENSRLTNGIKEMQQKILNLEKNLEKKLENISLSNSNTQLTNFQELADKIELLEKQMENKIKNIYIFNVFMLMEIKEFLKTNLEEQKAANSCLTNEIEVKEMKQKIINLESNLEKTSFFNSNTQLTNSQELGEKIELFEKRIENKIENITNFIDLPISCREKMNSIYLLKIYNSELPPFHAHCYFGQNHSWTVIQRRQDGSVDFYRNWDAYKNGFGDVNGEYWLGLERLHQMTKHQNYELWIKLKDFKGIEQNAYFSKFSIASEEKNYKLTIDGYSGDAGDSFSYNNGKNFSTYDKDNDNGDGNCAEDRNGAWWYHQCTHCNLNGLYGSDINRKSINWLGFNGDYKGLKFSQMAIRPRAF